MAARDSLTSYALPVALTFDGSGGFKPGHGDAGWTLYRFATARERAVFMASHPASRMPAWLRIANGEAV
jgi:hypothetical protein